MSDLIVQAVILEAIMIKPTKVAAICFVIGGLTALAARAESVLDRLPEDAIGFVLARNLSETNAKLEGVLTTFQIVAPTPLPAPLALIKRATGLGPGLNERGDALLAILPGNDGIEDLRPLLLISVSDYGAFATAIQGDATGEICRVTLAGEEVLVAKLADYAALMNVEHRERLEKLLASEPSSHRGVQPLNDWLQSQDVSAALTPRGVDMLTEFSQAGMVDQAAAMRQHMTPEAYRQLEQSMAMYGDALAFLGAELEAAAVGLAIVDDSNVKLTTQAVLSSGGKLSAFAATLPSAGAALNGFADKPYIVAAGGQVTPEFAEAVARINVNLLKADPKSHGFENLTDDDWRDVEASWLAYTQGIQAASIIAYLGDDSDPLVSNIGGVLTVGDSGEYLKLYAASIKKWNALLKKSTLDIELEYLLTDVEVAGRKGLLTTVDIGKAAEDPNVPSIKFMMDALLGEEGELKIYLAPTDDHTVAFGIDDEEGFAKTIEAIAKTEQPLADAADVQTTLRLLPGKSGWIGLADPQGVVVWCERLYNKLLSQLGPASLELPDYPDSPPVGVAITISQDRLSGEVALPKKAIEAIAAYLQKLQENAD